MQELDLDPGDNAWWWGNSKLADGVDVTVQFNGSITVDDHKTGQRLGKFEWHTRLTASALPVANCGRRRRCKVGRGGFVVAWPDAAG
jgi:hypothetical protein